MTHRFIAVTLLVLACACGGDAEKERRYSPEECSSARDQILLLLQVNVEAGILIGSAVPCGSDGITADPSAFHPEAPQADVDRLRGQFGDLCSDYAEHCDSTP